MATPKMSVADLLASVREEYDELRALGPTQGPFFIKIQAVGKQFAAVRDEIESTSSTSSTSPPLPISKVAQLTSELNHILELYKLSFNQLRTMYTAVYNRIEQDSAIALFEIPKSRSQLMKTVKSDITYKI